MDKVRMVDSSCILNSGTELGLVGDKVEAAIGILSPSCSCLEETDALEVSAANNGEIESANVSSCRGLGFVSEHSTKVHGTGPITPSPDRQNSELSTRSDQTEEEISSLGCQTPKGSIFDPFAPGPEELACAPRKKTVTESRIPICRRLNFDSFIESSHHQEKRVVDDVEEEQLQDLISQSILEVAVLNQLREISDENVLKGIDSSKEFMTPSFVQSLTGVAESCPAAPPPAPAYKTVSMKYRKLSPGICRRLF